MGPRCAHLDVATSVNRDVIVPKSGRNGNVKVGTLCTPKARHVTGQGVAGNHAENIFDPARPKQKTEWAAIRGPLGPVIH